jgi:hypothetical protein
MEEDVSATGDDDGIEAMLALLKARWDDPMALLRRAYWLLDQEPSGS